MGWSTGSLILEQVVGAIEGSFDPEENYEALIDVYSELIDIFEDYDCDTIDECIGLSPAFDEAIKLHYPECFEED